MNFKRIGIFGSEENDFKELLSKSKIIREEQFGEGKIFETILDGEKILFVATGYNKVNLGLTAGYVIKKYRLDSIIGLGNCGYLDEYNCESKIGNIAIVKNSVQYTVNSTAIGYPDTVIPGVGLGVFKSNQELVKIAEEACKKLKYEYEIGKAATSEKFIANNRERKFIANEYESQFIDMECGGLGQIGYIFDIPVVFVKGISNLANDNAGYDYQKYSKQVTESSNKVVYVMLKITGR